MFVNDYLKLNLQTRYLNHSLNCVICVRLEGRGGRRRIHLLHQLSRALLVRKKNKEQCLDVSYRAEKLSGATIWLGSRSGCPGFEGPGFGGSESGGSGSGGSESEGSGSEGSGSGGSGSWGSGSGGSGFGLWGFRI